jgi:hypothetical protein
MRPALIGALLASLLAPTAAGAFEYVGPSASLPRGAALTFKVRTSGNAKIRVSGSPATDAKGLLTGAKGTWVDERPSVNADGVLTWKAPKGFLARHRPGTYWWQAYSGNEIGPVRTLTVTLPAVDRGRGALYPRYGKRGHGSFYLSSANWPKTLDGLRFRALAKTAAKRWGLKALTWTSLAAGKRDGFSVVGFSNKLPAGTLGLETDYRKRGKVVERDLLLRADADWNAGAGYPNLDQVDLESVLIHELGHMAGVKKHQPRCTNSPMVKALGTGEWWRGPSDYFFGDC